MPSQKHLNDSIFLYYFILVFQLNIISPITIEINKTLFQNRNRYWIQISYFSNQKPVQ